MLLFFKQPLAQVPHRIPHREEPYGDNRYEYQYDVRCMHAYRIGVHYKTSVAAAQRYKSEALLQETQQQPQYNPGNCSEHRNQPPFKKEDTGYQPVVGAQIAQRFRILALIQYQHGQRTDNIEAGNCKYKGKEQVGDEFLNLHDTEYIRLLLVAVLHDEAVAQGAFHFLLHGIGVAARFQFQFDGGNFRVIIEQPPGKAQRCEDIA